MKKQEFTIEFITPCFCAGADQTVAEVRAPSIRGQLRWWFRTLGGFSIQSRTLKIAEKEAEVFGDASDGNPQKSKLLVRIRSKSIETTTKELKDFGWDHPTDPHGYLLFNLRSNQRGLIEPGSTINVELIWKGPSHYWDSIVALWNVFTTFGALGTRSRRGFGSISSIPTKEPIDVGYIQQYFSEPQSILVFDFKEKENSNKENWEDAIGELGCWLKEWRSHGRTIDHHKKQPDNIGFPYAENDHDLGVKIIRSEKPEMNSYRAALGLPIIQLYSNKKKALWNHGKEKDGRFASPIMFRVTKEGTKYHPQIIFVEKYKWNDNANSLIIKNGEKWAKGSEIGVSLDLYEAMKNDEFLTRRY
ncbi:MAG: type III-B CRISPR module RAMP protein Cmr1 [Opitutales bacterium]|nr:type III-B CRISPR module RAMP protein Cmr1 [Opitutales bacterium]